MTTRLHLIIPAALLFALAGCASPDAAHANRHDPMEVCERYGPTDVQGFESDQREVTARYNQTPRQACRKQ